MKRERLTGRNNGGLAYLLNVKPNEQAIESSYPNTLNCILQSFERLAKYEDTGCYPIENDMSDGYHTFSELYEHRAVLFAVICNTYKDKAWKSFRHSDGTMFDGGYFVVGIQTPKGQYSYHYKIEKHWGLFNVEQVDFAPEYDGHQPNDIGRLLSLLEVG